VWCSQSGIHGWGLFAKVDMAQDTMVAEYCGVRMRREVADRREEKYRREGKDCYLFAVSDDCVIDSTLRGTISRFTVRSPCGPQLTLTLTLSRRRLLGLHDYH
jgi:SET domain-containing protein